MKVTALVPDDIIEEVKSISGGKNITESLIIALKYYINNKKINKVIDEIETRPFEFNEGFTSYGIRKANRNR